MTVRRVRATRDFFHQLDEQLPAERTDRAPSRTDFQASELLKIVDRFAVGWDDLPEVIPGRPEYRLLLVVGRVVPVISVIGQLAPDGAVELVRIELDLDPPWGDEPEED